MLRLIAWVSMGIAVFFGLAASAVFQKSLTSDEPVHLAAGYSLWKNPSQVFNPEHPPLVKMIAAIPLVLTIHVNPESLPGWKENNQWKFSDALLFQNQNPLDQLTFWARCLCLAFGVLGCIVIFLFSRSLWGLPGGFLSLILSILCPNFLAHASLVHTDMAVTFGAILFVYLGFRYAQVPNRKNIVYCALALGFSLCVKFSAVLLCPLAILGFASANKSNWKTHRKEVWLQALFLLVIPVLMMSWIYGEIFNLRPYLEGLFSVYGNHDPNYSYYLNGSFQKEGFFSYYFVAIFLKTPIPTLLLWFLGLIALAKLPRKMWAFLLLPPMVFFIAGTLARHNIGVRHVLPCFPFFMVMAGGVTQLRLRIFRIVIPALCCLWLVWENFSIYPHYLAYFNQFAGGPQNGIRHLDDSNIDWGQDLKALKKRTDELGMREINLEYFGRDKPAARGISYAPMSIFHMYFPQDDNAVSVNYLIRDTLRPEVKDYRYDWLDRYQPADRIGYSIYLYRFRLGEQNAFRDGVNYLERSSWLEHGFQRLTALVTTNPQFVPGILALAQAHYRYGDRTKSRALLEQALRQEPDNPQIKALKASLFNS